MSVTKSLNKSLLQTTTGKQELGRCRKPKSGRASHIFLKVLDSRLRRNDGTALEQCFVKYFLLLILGIFILPASLVAGPLEEGHDAFDREQYQRAYQLWRPLAEQGDPEAQYNIGLLFMNGNGVEQNERTALHWFTRAGEQGLADAQYNAGVLFYTGKGVYPDNKSAIEWWQLAANQGHPNAQNNLAIMHAFAYGTKRDPDQAIKLWTAAAKQGHPDAINSLISAYSGAIAGFSKDLKKAEYWLDKKPTEPVIKK
ncbi:MAG: tetratricopeptide repeat protein [Thioalkalispiraceae bacterium]|jgi:TPR repeat protein